MRKLTANKREMGSKPRPNGYKNRERIKESAELVQESIADIVAALKRSNDAEVNRLLGLAIYKTQNALRNLEKIGAQTRPPEV